MKRNTNRSNQFALTANPEDTVRVDLWTAIVFESLSAATLEIDFSVCICHTDDDSRIFVALSGRLL